MPNKNEIIHSPTNGPGNGGLSRRPLGEMFPAIPEETIEALSQEPFHFATLPLREALLKPTQLPEPTLPDGSPKPNQIWARELPQWLLGAREEVSANLAITMVATDLEERINQSTDQLTPDIEDAISRLATAEARYAWAKITKEKSPENAKPDERITAQRKFLDERRKIRTGELKELFTSGVLDKLLPKVSRNAFVEFLQATKDTDVIFGRADRGFFDVIYITGLWEQLALRQEPKLDRDSGMPFIGLFLMATRHNPQTTELEFAISIDQEAGAISARSTAQTSTTRLPRYDGVAWMPREEREEAWLESVQQVLTDKKTTKGVRVSSINSDAARMVQADQKGKYAKPAVLMVHLDLDELPEKVRKSAEPLLENKHWLNLEQTRQLMEVSNNGIPTFVNVFTAAAVGMVVIHEYTELKSQIEQQREKITDATDTVLLQTQNMRKLMQKQGVEIPEVNELISQLLVVVTALSTHNTLAEKNIE